MSPEPHGRRRRVGRNALFDLADTDQPLGRVLATVRRVDAGGWHGVWFADHYMPNTEDEEIVDGPICWRRGRCSRRARRRDVRVRLGPLVSPTTVHHPALLANRAAAIDRISGGGSCSGWAPAGRSTSTRRTASTCRARSSGGSLRGGDPDRPLAARRARTTFAGAQFHTSATRRASPAGPVAASHPRRDRRPTDDADHRSARRRVEHVGRRRPWPRRTTRCLPTPHASPSARSRDRPPLRPGPGVLHRRRRTPRSCAARPKGGRSPARRRRCSTRSAATLIWASTSSSCRTRPSAGA